VSSFGDRLTERVLRCGNPVVVGLDPRVDQLPGPLRAGANDLAQQAAACERFCSEIIDVVAPLVPAVKPQAAFFELLGPAGMQALASVIAHARAAGLLVILDGKRNDIGSTATAYAEAYLGPDSPWRADALTISPYLGDDSLHPFVELAVARECGLFVLVKTSNPGGGQFQDLPSSGAPLYEHVARYVQQLAEETRGTSGYGAVGAVVGATYPEQLSQLRRTLRSAWILVPGYGQQGGTAADVAPAFDERGLGAVVNSSRGIIFAYLQKQYAERAGKHWQDAVAQATRDTIAAIGAETRARLLANSTED
jgi:orotidine-5'-phosphate decarboxylase